MIQLTKFQERPTINPNIRNKDRGVSLKTNLLKLRINNNINVVYVYSIKYDSSVPLDNTFIKRLILRNAQHLIKQHFQICIFAGDNLFSSKKIVEEMIFQSNVLIEEEERVYEIKINITDQTFDPFKRITEDNDLTKRKKQFVEILVKNILTANQLLRLRRLYFDKNESKSIQFNSFSKFI
jgi:hypothetical protein